MGMLLFIFGPLVSHQRSQAQNNGRPGTTRISGLESTTHTITTSTFPAGASAANNSDPALHWSDEEDPTHSSMRFEVERLRARVAELEGRNEENSEPVGDDK